MSCSLKTRMNTEKSCLFVCSFVCFPQYLFKSGTETHLDLVDGEQFDWLRHLIRGEKAVGSDLHVFDLHVSLTDVVTVTQTQLLGDAGDVQRPPTGTGPAASFDVRRESLQRRGDLDWGRGLHIRTSARACRRPLATR